MKNRITRRWPFLALTFLLVGVALPVLAASVTPGGMARADYTFPPLPSYYSGTQTGYYNFDVNMTVQDDPGTSARYFWAYQFSFNNGSNGYMGLQTNGSINGQTVGNIAIFSIWNAKAAEAGSGATCATFTGEGDGYSCRLPYDWIEDRVYRLRLAEVCCADQPNADEWWGFWVKDLTSGVEKYVGKIKVPGSWKWLNRSTIGFSEYYTAVSGCEATPYGRIRYENAKADYGSFSPQSNSASTYGTCKDFAKAWCSGTTCYHTTGSGVRNWITVSKGASGPDVYAIQYLLRAHGYSLTVDGIFGSGTESTVKSFQSSKGLTADGIVGPNTWEQLVITVQKGSSGDAVRAVQYLLKHKFGYNVTVDGIFGSGTESTVKSFQTAKFLTSDGIVGKNTWSVLE